MKRYILAAGTLLLVLSVMGGCTRDSGTGGLPTVDENAKGAPIYPSIVHIEQGGKKMVVPSGSEVELQSGSTLDVQSGSTTSYGGSVSVAGLTDSSYADIVGRLMVGATPASTPVAGAASISGAASVGGDLTVTGNGTLGSVNSAGRLMIGATPASTPAAGAASIAGAASVGSLNDAGAADVAGRLMVGATPAATPVAGAASIAGAASVGSLTNAGAADIAGRLMVGATPAATPVAGAASIAGAASVGSLTNAGAADIVGRLMVGATPAATPVAGAANIAGALGVGGSTTFNAADMNGTKLTLDADADSYIDESSDDVIDMLVNAAAGYWNILTGNLKVGNGSPGVTMDGEDAYIEGTLEVDSAALFDGGVDLNGQSILLDPLQISNFSASTNGYIWATVPASGTFGVSAGNIRVGAAGSPGLTLNGEDGYVQGTFEVDGATQFDGGTKVTTITGANAETIDNATNGYWTFAGGLAQAADTTNGIGFSTWDSATVITTTNGALWTIPASQKWMVHRVFCAITTNFDCTGDDCTLIIGDDTDTDGFLTLADAELQAADTEGTGWPAGWQGFTAATVGAFLDGGGWGFPYVVTQTIDIAIEDTSDHSDPTAGAATCYLNYTRFE